MSKKLMIIAAAIMSMTVLQAKTPAQKLIKRINKIQQKGYMMGHQDDPFYGLT